MHKRVWEQAEVHEQSICAILWSVFYSHAVSVRKHVSENASALPMHLRNCFVSLLHSHELITHKLECVSKDEGVCPVHSSLCLPMRT